MSENKFEKLRQLMKQLRDKEKGCRWTSAQTLQSLAPHTHEEIHELIEAIETNDESTFKEELADLLYHVIFYADIAEERNLFTIDDIIDVIFAKNKRRRPPNNDRQQYDFDKTNAYWEQAKREERLDKNQHSQLDGITSNLPATTRAQKLQQRAALVGFDWENLAPIFEKIHEEINELHDAIDNDYDHDTITSELGDLLFSCINLGRHLEINAEQALRMTNRKFTARFQSIEQQLKAQNKRFQDCTLDELETLWQKAKNDEA